jgi:very-short-patch-repair endonuclease
MTFIPDDKHLKEFSKKLRLDSILSQVLLWKYLRAKQIGYTFNHKKPLLNYIVYFYCKPLNLAIEIDGGSHNSKYDLDVKRQDELEAYGLIFLRFDDQEVKQDINNVLRTIEGWIDANK